jgi:hypothetical protein
MSRRQFKSYEERTEFQRRERAEKMGFVFQEKRRAGLSLPAKYGGSTTPKTLPSSIIDEMKAVERINDEESNEKINPRPIIINTEPDDQDLTSEEYNEQDLTSEEYDEQDLASEEYDKIMGQRLNEVAKIVQEYYLDSDHRIIERRINVEWIDGMQNVLRTLKEEMKRSIGLTPRETCNLYDKLYEDEKCTLCATETTIDYCNDDCSYCKRQRKVIETTETNLSKSKRMKRRKAEEVAKYTPLDPSVLGMSTLTISSTTTSTPSTPSTSTPTTPRIIPRSITLNPQTRNGQLNRLGNFRDKFLAVTYAVADTDMKADRSNERELSETLVNNFRKLLNFQGMPALGFLYVIENTIALVPHLYGLVRFTMSGRVNKAISATDGTFKGKNKIAGELRESKEKMLLKPENVAGWIAYMIKDGAIMVGDLDAITNGWTYIPAPPHYPWDSSPNK